MTMADINNCTFAGQGYVREMILDGADADSIAARWSADVDAFKEMRKPYLLYPEN